MFPLDDLLGDSPACVEIRAAARKLLQRGARSGQLPPVLIEGETGTGKGLLARSLHRAAPRAGGPFVHVDCAAIPETLIEAELFGFERGAFTDARQSKPGLFQTAHRGTIFLDEIGLLPLALQAKLLTVLEDRAVRRLGATHADPVDVWVLAATNEELGPAMARHRFRADLYHRLAVVRFFLPPLRERPTDIVALAEHLLARACAEYALPAKRLDASAGDALRAYSWPGNVRELSNIMERTALMSDDAVVTASALRLPRDMESTPAQREAGSRLPLARDDGTEVRLREALTRGGWNISRAARELGVSRNTVYAWIGAYGLRAGHGRAVEPRAGRVMPSTPTRAPTVVPHQATSGLAVRWEARPVAIMGIRVEGRPPAEGLRGRVLEVVSGKLRSFGGQIEGLSPAGLVATFGLMPVEATDHLGLHAAMAIQRASERTYRNDGMAVTIRVGLHGERALVGVGGEAPVLDAEFRNRAWDILDHLLEACPPGGIALSRELASKLRGRFEFAALAATVPAVRLVDLARAGLATHESRSQTARELAEPLLDLARREQDPALLLRAHYAMGTRALLPGGAHRGTRPLRTGHHPGWSVEASLLLLVEGLQPFLQRLGVVAARAAGPGR